MNQRIRVPVFVASIVLLVAIVPASAVLASDGADQGDGALTAKQQKEIVAALQTPCAPAYVLADKGARVADEIEQQAAAGAFASATRPADLARALTKALWEASHDKHLRVTPPGDSPLRRIVRSGNSPSARGRRLERRFVGRPAPPCRAPGRRAGFARQHIRVQRGDAVRQRRGCSRCTV